jgi:hypothetical protein
MVYLATSSITNIFMYVVMLLSWHLLERSNENRDNRQDKLLPG